MINDIWSDNNIERTISWFGESTGTLFLDKVSQWLMISQKELETASDPPSLYRAQGQVQAYRSIINIPEECRRLKEDKKAGRRS
jgi:hypothetical protein